MQNYRLIVVVGTFVIALFCVTSFSQQAPSDTLILRKSHWDAMTGSPAKKALGKKKAKGVIRPQISRSSKNGRVIKRRPASMTRNKLAKRSAKSKIVGPNKNGLKSSKRKRGKNLLR